ncbi:MAG: nitroreductase family deazaflavin-dependent oxidoreductase [Chloroflexi bacterium]|nr:MAG: nitroreductase family deazaflavin-dependent oxidoreductase [Chloroflexota bacterium]
MSDMNKEVIEEFRANGGKVGGYFEKMSLLLLHTTGAKSRLPRINPVVQIADGDRFVVIASKAGAPNNPDWYHNLVANPGVSVEVGSEQFEGQAEVATEPERTELYNKMAEQYPIFTEYEQKTERTIPVVILTRNA